jgi:hypothetical protein
LKDQTGVLWADIEEPLGRELQTRYGLTPGEYLLFSPQRVPIQKGFFPRLSIVKHALNPGKHAGTATRETLHSL